MRACKHSSSAVAVAAILSRIRSSPASYGNVGTVALTMVSSMAAGHGLPHRSCDFDLRCTVVTIEVPEPWVASDTPCTALRPMVEQALAIFTPLADLRRVPWPSAESLCMPSPRMVVCDSGEGCC